MTRAHFALSCLFSLAQNIHKQLIMMLSQGFTNSVHGPDPISMHLRIAVSAVLGPSAVVDLGGQLL